MGRDTRACRWVLTAEGWQRREPLWVLLFHGSTKDIEDPDTLLSVVVKKQVAIGCERAGQCNGEIKVAGG